MAGVNGIEAIVEGGEEIRGRKIVNRDMDTSLAKRVEAEGKGCGTQEEEEAANDKVERLRESLKCEPRMVIGKKAEEVIRCLGVDDIIGWASRSDKAKENTIVGYGYLDLKAGHFAPSPEMVGRLIRLMLVCGVEKLKAADLYILYNNLPKAGFASMLLHALDSYSRRHLDSNRSVYPKEKRFNIFKACTVLRWKLLTHVMYKLTSLAVFENSVSTITASTGEEEEMLKKAAENCNICNGNGKHDGVYGYYCSYWQSAPFGSTVGPMHVVLCRRCCAGRCSHPGKTVVRCSSCGSREGKAVPCSLLWDSDI